MTLADLHAQRDAILQVAARHGASDVRVFGSVARGEAGPQSDVDFLVGVRPPLSAWFPAGMVLDLERLLGQRVEVATEDSLHHLLRERILREAVPLEGDSLEAIGRQ